MSVRQLESGRLKVRSEICEVYTRGRPNPQWLTGTLSKVDLNVGNFELWMTVMLTVESADQI